MGDEASLIPLAQPDRRIPGFAEAGRRADDAAEDLGERIRCARSSASGSPNARVINPAASPVLALALVSRRRRPHGSGEPGARGRSVRHTGDSS